MGSSFLLKQSCSFRIICVCRGSQSVLCLAGCSSLRRAGSFVLLWALFLLVSQLTRLLWDARLLLWRHGPLKAAPVSDQASFLAGFALADRCCFSVSKCWLSGLADRGWLCTFLPAFPKALCQSLHNTWFKHPSSGSSVLGCFSGFWRRIVLWVRREQLLRGGTAVRHRGSDLARWHLSQAVLAANPELTRSPLLTLLIPQSMLPFSNRNRFLVGPWGCSHSRALSLCFQEGTFFCAVAPYSSHSESWRYLLAVVFFVGDETWQCSSAPGCNHRLLWQLAGSSSSF